jgi:hypothetical protein
MKNFLRPASLALSFVCALLIGSSSLVRASSWVSANNGVGIAIGDPGGITFFHKLEEKSFVQAYVSRYFLVGADYAMVFPRAIYAVPELTPYIGGGAFMFSTHYWYYDDYRRHSDLGIGGRIPLGLMLQIPDAPIHIHLEIAPTTTVIPFIWTYADAQLGVRFLF